MRILQIIPSISQVYGGPSQMVLGLSQALGNAGVEVTILSTNTNGDRGQPTLDVPLGVPIAGSNYQIRYFANSPFRRYKFSFGLLNWLRHHAHEYDLAHIHALFSPVSSCAATIARRHKLPYVLRPLGTLDPADLRKKRWLKQVYAGLLEAENLRGAAALHFTSPQEAKISERFGAVTRDWIYPLGVQLPEATLTAAEVRSRYQIPPDRPILLFLSRIDPKKGLDLLIPALEDLAQRQDFQFLLAGSNPQDPDYERQILQRLQASALQSRTTIAGFVSGGLKTSLLAAADLFVLPSYYENFGIAVAEAMAVGTPVLISDQVHIWEAIAQSQSGWICRCTVDSLRETLETALQDAGQRQERGLHAQHYAQTHFTWEAIAQSLVLEYQQILQPKP
jgi:glycosyltransferase involved in cell wall biosynthesis